MKNIKYLNYISKNICENIRNIHFNERGFISQNILSQLRNFVECTAVCLLEKSEPNVLCTKYQDITKALEYISTKGQYRDLSKFHKLLQKSVSHYTVGFEASERLMLKYYEYLYKTKVLIKKQLACDILMNITDFPLNQDPQLSEYYEKISEKIERLSTPVQFNDRFYIHKIKPFFVNHKIYYEVTFVLATNNTSKFERVIAFTSLDIMANYAVRLSIQRVKIEVMKRDMVIFIINGWEVAIRPCEIKNFSKIFDEKIQGTSQADLALMSILTNKKLTLVELVNSTDDFYENFKNEFIINNNTPHFFKVLDRCRNLVKNNQPGANIIQYLLYRMNNRIIKSQYNENGKCPNLSNLALNYACIPFDQMPFATSPIQHNPPLIDLFDCFEVSGREHEIFAKKITTNAEIEHTLFTNKEEFDHSDCIDQLIDNFNNNLYQGKESQKERALEILNNHIYISGYVNNCVEIIDQIKKLTTSGLNNYSNSVIDWLEKRPNPIDCIEKKEILIKLFENSKVALIYGAAGTGKSTLISYIASFFLDHKKLFLTNTHSAKSNLERKIGASVGTYKTIRSFINNPDDCDILIIDEASTISNKDMKTILRKASYKLLLLVGDNYQIESIRFGNWFDIIKSFIPDSSVHELTNTYRSSDTGLLDLWTKVRNIDDSILESLVVRRDYSTNLDESIFDITEENQIILCLNYDGLYGINNINRLLQESNPNKSIQWGINLYKVGDPILFNELDRFSPLIHNNLKGKIIDFYEENNSIWFDIEIDSILNESDVWGYNDLEFLDNADNGNAIIRFSVEKNINTDEDDLFSEKTMPFQVAYAISIHKAQGLEYDSVKIVINNEADEAITHNIFYTAITRAKNKLKIYWSPESEKRILESFKMKNYRKDIKFLEDYMKKKVETRLNKSIHYRK